jgi:hypothetical protein
VHLLYLTHGTGYVQVLTFPSRLERALRMIELADAPVVLRLPAGE